jgi:hypothetical protein
MSGFMYLPFWRAGGWQDITYRTQIYLAPLSEQPVTLGVYLYENGGKPWTGKTFSIEIDQSVSEATTDNNGMIQIDMGPGQTVRIEINVLDHEYGTGEVHLLSGDQPVALLSRGDLETFAAEAAGFEMSTSEITITGARPVVLEPGK